MTHDYGDLWPEDVLTEAEWESGWFDRQVIAGKRQEWERALFPGASVAHET